MLKGIAGDGTERGTVKHVGVLGRGKESWPENRAGGGHVGARPPRRFLHCLERSGGFLAAQ